MMSNSIVIIYENNGKLKFNNVTFKQISEKTDKEKI